MSIQLLSNDALTLDVPLALAGDCAVIQGFLEEDPDCEIIPVPEASHAVMKKIFDVLERRRLMMDAGKSLAAVAAWMHLSAFEELSRDAIFELITAANYLGCEVLVDGLASFIAHKTSTLSRDDMRSYLGIINDFTPEEEADVIQENSWAFP
jgi:S-phase kinase-associated protein 1